MADMAHVHTCPRCQNHFGCGRPVHERNRAMNRVSELEAAILKYGGHEEHCENPKHFCTCGFGDLCGEIIGGDCNAK